MKLREKVVVVTGGASGIGRSLAFRFASEGARAIVIADLDLASAEEIAGRMGGIAVKTDVGLESDLIKLVDQTMDLYGQIDLFCSNAGIGGVPGFEQVSNEDWDRIWRINVLGHVYAARAVLPAMLARGEGYLLNTASAAGLLTQIGSAPYSVTKHAAVAFAEWLAITYGDRGIKVSCLCRQGVLTPMLTAAAEQGSGAFLLEGALAPEEVAESVVKAIDREQFLILPHPEVARYFQNKANDYERWLAGMRKLQVKNEALKK